MASPSIASLVVLVFLVARPAAAAPGAAALIAPSGDVNGTTITFSWESVPDSTWYLWWLGKGSPTEFVMQQWYSAEQAGCANGGTCTISVTPPVNAGSHTWFIQTWGAGLTGPWSTGKVFVVKDPTQNWGSRLPPARRFTLVLDGEAALDNETGLVWHRTPSSTLSSWGAAQVNCADLIVGNRRGWRLPTVYELHTLVDPSQLNPALPPGHPFTISLSVTHIYWTQTLYGVDPAQRLAVSLAGGGLSNGPTNSNLHYWCVRAPAATSY